MCVCEGIHISVCERVHMCICVRGMHICICVRDTHMYMWRPEVDVGYLPLSLLTSFTDLCPTGQCAPGILLFPSPHY